LLNKFNVKFILVIPIYDQFGLKTKISKVISLKEKIRCKSKLFKKPPPLPRKIHTKVLGLDIDRPDETITHKIWIYWHEPTLPKIVEICIRQIERLNTEYSVVVLNKDTYKNYVGDLDLYLAKVTVTTFTDLLRLELVSKYGGIWLDASILFFKSIDQIFSALNLNICSPILFYTDIFCKYQERPIIETWFIASPPRDPFILAWKEEFYKALNSENPYDYYDADDEKVLIHQNLHDPKYLLAYVSAQKVLLHNNSYSLNLIRSEDLGHYFFYSGEYRYDPKYVADLLSQYKRINESFYFVKMEGSTRNMVENYIKKGLYNKTSWVGSLIKL